MHISYLVKKAADPARWYETSHSVRRAEVACLRSVERAVLFNDSGLPSQAVPQRAGNAAASDLTSALIQA